jgi:hypothetical protein
MSSNNNSTRAPPESESRSVNFIDGGIGMVAETHPLYRYYVGLIKLINVVMRIMRSSYLHEVVWNRLPHHALVTTGVRYPGLRFPGARKHGAVELYLFPTRIYPRSCNVHILCYRDRAQGEILQENQARAWSSAFIYRELAVNSNPETVAEQICHRLKAFHVPDVEQITSVVSTMTLKTTVVECATCDLALPESEREIVLSREEQEIIRLAVVDGCIYDLPPALLEYAETHQEYLNRKLATMGMRQIGDLNRTS